MKLIFTIEKGIGFIENFLLVIFLTVTVIMAFMQVILREFWSTGIVWGDVFLRHLVLWIGFFGAALAAKESRHFSINIFTKRLAPVWQRIIQALLNLGSAVVCSFLVEAGISFVRDEIKYNNEPLFVIFGRNVMSYHFEVIIPLGFGLIGLHFLFRAIEVAAYGPKSAEVM
jgi:TRAP-type C4-dicarboxylate transport system permease small subunit